MNLGHAVPADDADGLRVVVTGTGGRLGAAVARVLRQRGHRVVAWDRKALDLTSPERIDDHFGAVRFDAVVHCAAATSLDWCEANEAEAMAVNAEAPARIAGHCLRQSARMIQVSTDYVYDGTRPGLRLESDALRPLGVYARTKAAGERAALTSGARALVARTSWVFGPDRPAFVDQMLAAAQRGGPCEAIADKWSSPSYSMEMAGIIDGLLRRPDVDGVINLCNAGSCSWQEYGQAALDIASGLGLTLRCRQVEPLRLAEMKAFVAPRPVHTGMDCGRLAALGLAPRPWREALADYIATYHCG